MKLACCLLATIGVLSSLLGCARRPAGHYQPLAPTVATAPPHLLFFSGRLSAEATGTRLVVLGARAVAGELKLPEAEADTPDFLRVSQLDARGQALAQVRVPHPLRRNVEHVAADQRTFQRSEVKLPTAEFFVRLALQPAATTLRVEEVADGKTSLLSEFSISMP